MKQCFHSTQDLNLQYLFIDLSQIELLLLLLEEMGISFIKQILSFLWCIHSSKALDFDSFWRPTCTTSKPQIYTVQNFFLEAANHEGFQGTIAFCLFFCKEIFLFGISTWCIVTFLTQNKMGFLWIFSLFIYMSYQALHS